MRVLLLIGDGMGDRPIPELNFKTPLEYANTPNMDRLAKEGECGILDPIDVGIRAGSDTSHLAFLGYDPYKTYTGRGPFEAAGIGMDVQSGDISFRCNFATVDESMKVIDRRAGRIEQGTEKLAKDLNGLEIEGVTFYFKESVGHRAALVMRGKDLGCNITDIDPHKEGEKIIEPKAQDKESKISAKLLYRFVQESYKILKDHPVNKERKKEGKLPANIILPRGGGVAPHLVRFQDKYNLTSCCIVEVGLIKGIGKYLGMDLIDVVGATGGLDTDLDAIGKALLEAVNNYQFVLGNVKGPDVAGHDRDYQAKVKIIERIDKMLGEILNNLSREVLIVLTADHSTPVALGDHSGDAVPIVFWGGGVRVDEVKSYGEREVAKGGLGRIKALNVMNIITNLIGVAEKFGA